MSDLHAALQEAARRMFAAWTCGMGARLAELLAVSRPTAGRLLDGRSPLTVAHLCAAASARAGHGATQGELWNALDELLDVVREWANPEASDCPTCGGQGTQLGAGARDSHAGGHSSINDDAVYCGTCAGAGRTRGRA